MSERQGKWYCAFCDNAMVGYVSAEEARVAFEDHRSKCRAPPPSRTELRRRLRALPGQIRSLEHFYGVKP